MVSARGLARKQEMISRIAQMATAARMSNTDMAQAIKHVSRDLTPDCTVEYDTEALPAIPSSQELIYLRHARETVHVPLTRRQIHERMMEIDLRQMYGQS